MKKIIISAGALALVLLIFVSVSQKIKIERDKASLVSIQEEVETLKKEVDKQKVKLEATRGDNAQLIEEGKEILSQLNLAQAESDRKDGVIYQLQSRLSETELLLADAEIQLEHSQGMLAYVSETLGISVSKTSIDQLAGEVQRIKEYAESEGLDFNQADYRLMTDYAGFYFMSAFPGDYNILISDSETGETAFEIPVPVTGEAKFVSYTDFLASSDSIINQGYTLKVLRDEEMVFFAGVGQNEIGFIENGAGL